MDKDQQELASLYVLDQLSGDDLKTFEAMLAVSDELKVAVRELRWGMFEPFKNNEEPLRMDLLEGIHARLETKTGEKPTGSESQVIRSVPWAQIWGAAAVLFLGINFVLLYMLREEDSLGSEDLLARMQDQVRIDAGIGSGLESIPMEESLDLHAQVQRLQEVLSARETDLLSRDEFLASLYSENEEIRAYNAGWQIEYNRLMAKFVPFFESNDGMSRFTVIEMVDAQAYATQAPRRGFADLAGSFLAGEGNIANAGEIAFVGPVAAGIGIQTTAEEAAAGGLTPSLMTGGATIAGTIPEDSFSDIAAESEVESAHPIVETGDPAGFTVWRDDEQKGFLDLYNLPEPLPGEAAFLWVRASELEQFVPVGYLPELDDGTGSLFYAVDEPNFTPTEILITSEYPDEPGVAPSKDVLLRGP